MTRPDNPSLGIALRIFSGILFTGMVVCVKALSDAAPLGQIVFFRSFFARIAMTLWFSYAEASRLAPFEYVALLWPVLAGLLIFNLPLGMSFLFALTLVLLGVGVAAFEKKAELKKP